MSQPSRPPNRLVERWEALSPRARAAIAVPTLVVLLFLVNLGPFNQPLGRSVIYGLLEGGVFAGVLLAVTAQQQGQRDASGGGARTAKQQEHPTDHERDGDGDPDDLPGQS